MIETFLNIGLLFILGVLSTLFYKIYYRNDFERQSLFFSVCSVLLMTCICMDFYVHIRFHETIHEIYFPNYIFLLESWALLYAYLLEVYSKLKESCSFFVEMFLVSVLMIILTFYFYSLPSFKIFFELPFKTLFKLQQHFLAQILALLIGLLLFVLSGTKRVSVTFIFLIVHTVLNAIRIYIKIILWNNTLNLIIPLEYTNYFICIIVSICFLFKIYIMINKRSKALKD